MDQTLHTKATKEREEIKGTTKQKMAMRHNKEATDRRQWKTLMEGYIPAVDGQSLDERRKK